MRYVGNGLIATDFAVVVGVWLYADRTDVSAEVEAKWECDCQDPTSFASPCTSPPTTPPTPAPTGSITASQTTIELNQSTTVTYTYSPSSMSVSLHYSNGYVTPDNSCVTAESLDGGAIRLSATGQGSKNLIGCSLGTTVVSLRRNADNSVLDDVTITVTSPPPPPTPTPTPAVRFSSHSYSVDEGASQPIEVRLSRAGGQNLDIPITVSGGTDTDSGDYSVDGLSSGKLRINSGDTSETFTIRAIQDTDCNNETVNLGFGTLPSGVGQGSPSNATLTIDDDDPCPPTNLEIRYHLIHSDRLVVTYDESTSIQRFYQFYIYRSHSENGGYLHQKTEDDDASPVEFSGTGIVHGKWYKAKGRTCKTESRTGCGNWSDESAAFFFDAPPTITSVAVDPDDADRLVVNYTGATSQTGYFRFQILRSATQGGSHDVVYTVDDALANDGVEFDGLDHSRWYQFRAMSCRAGWDNCTRWSGYTDRVFLLAKTVLDVEPLPLRKARLSWDAVAVPSTHTAEYDLEIQESGGGWSSPRTEVLTDAFLEIDLDDIMFGDGLAHNPKYEVRVKALQKGIGGAADGMDGGYSDTITIIDNPILTGGRASGDSPGGSGQATLEWTRIPGATEYIVEYRKLGERSTYEGVPGLDHTSLSWPGQFDWPFYEQQSSSPDRFSPNGSNPQSRTIAGLDLGELYAFQVNYRTNTGMVFSARDAYVWVSDELPTRTSRVGTYPFFGYWEGGRYDYTICSATFTPNDGSWQNLIVHAFEQWEQAVPHRLTVTRRPGSCTTDGQPIDNDVPITLIRALFNESNEVYMVDTAGWDTADWEHVILYNGLFYCISGETPACVLSTRYTESPAYWLFNPSVRELDPGSVDVLVSYGIRGIDPQPGQPFNVNIHRKLDIPGVDTTVSVQDTRFNVCTSSPSDVDFRNYRTMVHESGHALGLSNFSWRNPFGSSVAHPSIPDSVMNYDSDVPQISNEPDCSPHPFDVMAIEGLYQTVVP